MNLILRERENLLDNFFKPFWDEEKLQNFNMPTDLKEIEDKYLVTADLPGLEEKDIKVEYDNGVLTITGERKEEKSDKNESVFRKEISYGKFSRSFRFGDSIKENDIKASFKNGVLSVALPKKEEKKPRQIPLH